MKVPFVDLQAQLKDIRPQVEKNIGAVLDKCNFILGDEVKNFETEFASYCGSKFSVGLASGLDALQMALRALDIKEGDEVIVPANTFIATALGVTTAGAKPVPVEMDDKTFLMDNSMIEAAITKRTKAIMPVHLYGRMSDMDPILALAKKYDLFVVEDAAQGHGAVLKGHKAGSSGHIGCFSFYPGKNLGAYGDGGGLTTNNPEWKDRVEALRNYGSPKKYHHPIIGFNSRLDTLQAAVLRAKLPHLDSYNQRRYQAAKKYGERLRGVGDLVLPEIPEAGSHVFHLYVLRTQKRDALLQHLSDKGVGCVIHYPTPLHLQGAYADLGYSKGAFPRTEKMAQEILSLPMFPELTDAQIDYVVAQVKDFFA